MGRFTEYLVIGRRLPTESEAEPPLYRMRIFAPNETVAKSRFFYFLRQLRKMKAATSEIVAIHAVSISTTRDKRRKTQAMRFGLRGVRYNSVGDHARAFRQVVDHWKGTRLSGRGWHGLMGSSSSLKAKIGVCETGGMDLARTGIRWPAAPHTATRSRVCCAGRRGRDAPDAE